MANYSDVTIEGPNYEYTFQVYDINTEFFNYSGVYIFSSGYPTATSRIDHNFIYIGETTSFKERLTPNHHEWKDAIQMGMTHISVLQTSNHVDIQNFLIGQFNPPLNDHYRTN